jgi:hypothetical protein
VICMAMGKTDRADPLESPTVPSERDLRSFATVEERQLAIAADNHA